MKFSSYELSKSLFFLISVLILKSRLIESSSSSTSPSLPSSSNPNGYEILSDKIVYKRWRSIIQRRVRFPTIISSNNNNSTKEEAKIVDYDIVDQKGVGAVLIFAFNSTSKTATLIKEYNPGIAKVLYGPPAGLIEKEKHTSPKDAAIQELEEECHLSGGKWFSLLSDDCDGGIAMDKYCTTKIIPYLVIDAHHVENPKALDEEEEIEIVPGIEIQEVKSLICKGELNAIGALGCMLAIQKLQELGLTD